MSARVTASINFLLAGVALEVFQDLAVALWCLGLVGRVDTNVFEKHRDRFCYRRGGALRLGGHALSWYKQLADQLIGFAALGFDGRLPGNLAEPLLSLPPFDEIGAGRASQM